MATAQQVQHYQAQAQQATRLAKRLNPQPDVSALAAQWQGERRSAVVLLRAQRDQAHARGDFDAADAYLLAIVDVDNALRSRAAWAIEEGMRMPFVHGVCA